MDLEKKFHICFLAERFSVLERTSKQGFLIPLARNLSQKGHKVTVISNQERSYGDSDKSIHKGNLNIQFVKARGSFLQQALRDQFEKSHQESPFDIVHVVSKQASFLKSLKRKHNLAIILDARSTEISQIYSLIAMNQNSFTGELKTGFSVIYKFLTSYYRKDRKLLKMSDSLLVTSPQQQNAFERYYLYPESRTFILPYGIELIDPSEERKKEIMKKLTLSSDHNVVCMVTDMMVKEEVFPILEAFQKVVIKKPSSRLIIVGTNPLSKDIERKIFDLVLGNKVIAVESVSNVDVTDYISICDIFIDLSARSSGFEPSLLEAMNHKKIIIGSEIGSISTLIENEVEGFLVRPFDRAFLQNLMLQVFNKEIDSIKMGESTYKKVNQFFDSNVTLQKTISTYFETLKRKKRV